MGWFIQAGGAADRQDCEDAGGTGSQSSESLGPSDGEEAEPAAIEGKGEPMAGHRASPPDKRGGGGGGASSGSDADAVAAVAAEMHVSAAADRPGRAPRSTQPWSQRRARRSWALLREVLTGGTTKPVKISRSTFTH